MCLFRGKGNKKVIRIVVPKIKVVSGVGRDTCRSSCPFRERGKTTLWTGGGLKGGDMGSKREKATRHRKDRGIKHDYFQNSNRAQGNYTIERQVVDRIV